ncbi:MAG: flagellar export chaperone FlgN [Myxococcota bacterium]
MTIHDDPLTRNTTPAPASDWVAHLESETHALRELLEAATQTRAASLTDRQDQIGPLLEKQALLCEKLERARTRRRALLQESGRGRGDFLVAVLSQTPPALHAQATARFSEYVDAAEAAQREIDINKEFFSIALSALDDIIGTVEGREPSYGPRPPTEPRLVSFKA